MTRPSAIAVVAGALGAALLVAATRQSVLGVLLGAMLSPLPLAMVVLGLGGAYLPVAIVGGAVTITVLTGSFAFGVVYLLVDAAPIAVLSRARLGAADPTAPVSGTALARTVCWLSLGAALIVLGALVLMSGSAEGIEAALRARIDEVLAMTPQGADTEVMKARAEMVRALAALLPGAVGLNWCLRAIVSGALAQMMLQRMGLAQGPAPDYRWFEVPRWYVLLFAGVAALALVLGNDAGFMAGNAAVVLSVPLVLHGTAVVHCGAARLRQRTMMLVIFYVVALLTVPASLVLLVALAVADHFLQLRGRFMTPRTGGK